VVKEGLDERSQRLVKLGIAIGAKQEGAVHSHVHKCREAGISDEEIYHAALLGITTMGWLSAMATLSWINDILKAIKVKK
jgi:alkylhydroperoxidase/carboxymuconolactone decarboxylase family protein YurZ